MADPITYVAAPPRKPRPNTSLHVLPVLDAPAEHYLNYQFIPDPCSFPNQLMQDCWVTMGPVADTAKNFGDAGDAVITQNFGAYQGVECWLSGGIDEFSGVAERVLRNGEYWLVDNALAQVMVPAATAITPAATTIVQAVGMLETYLSVQVPAQGYIFLSPLAATAAASENLLVRNIDGSLETYLGTPVVILTAASQVTTAFATGPVTIWRGPIISNQAAAMTDNLGRALAERLYSVAFECGMWKIDITTLLPGTQTEEPEPGTPLQILVGSIPSSPIPDGTDTTIIAQTNVTPTAEVFLHYAVNGGADITAGEMTQVDTHEFVWNVVGDATGPGDSVEVWAVSEYDGAPVESNHITIEVT